LSSVHTSFSFQQEDEVEDGEVLLTARHFKLRGEWAAVLGGLPRGALRLVSALQHWNLPTATLH
jgi:hypothetical protein